MPKVSPIQNSFTTGEVDPLIAGRTDIDRYRQGLNVCKNYIPTVQGPITRRPGTNYVTDVKTASSTTRLIEFEFSITQAYILEFGGQYIRFYKDRGQIELSGSPYEISSPYLEADLFQLKVTQSADVLYIVHPDYEPRALSRTAHTAWTLTLIDFQDGPYLPTNIEATTLTTSGHLGPGIVVTASAVTGINGGLGFLATDVGRHIRAKEGSLWGWAKITGYTSTTVVTIEIFETWTNAAAKTEWRLGLYSDTTGYPATVTFHEDRLGLAGVPDYPQRVDLSESGIYSGFAPSDFDGTVAADHALAFTFSANDVNVIRWAISGEKGLLIGTVGGEWVVSPSSQGEALTPTNITAKRSTSFGSADIQALQIGKAALFVQRAGRKVRELNYFYDVDGYNSTDVTVLASHISQSGIKEIVQQKEPHPILWAVRTDGVLIGLTYEREVDSFKAGWHRHIIGGSSDAAGTYAKVESVAVIPSPEGTSEDLWVVVQRYINGAVTRSVEFIGQYFDDTVEQKDAFFVDSGLTYDLPVTVSGATIADPCVVTAASHGFSDGDKVLFSDVMGMGELNGVSYLVANATTHTFELTDLKGVDIDSSSFTTYVSGGEVRKYISTLSGLSHLEGESVDILADGAVQPAVVVASGAISLSTPATTVHIGLGYESDGQMLRVDAGAADGTSLGKTRRTSKMSIMFHRSLGLKIGMSFDDLSELTFRTAADKLSRAPELFTGIRTENLGANYDYENQFCFRQSQPLPSTVLALMPQMITQDR